MKILTAIFDEQKINAGGRNGCDPSVGLKIIK